MHAVLLGDSIFDNAAYVRNAPAVIDQVRLSLPRGWQATLLAVDGHTIRDVANQLTRLPSDATHLFVSVGGNDALAHSHILGQPVGNVAAALRILQELRARFRGDYHAMLQALLAADKPVALCTIYDSIPGLSPAQQAAVAGFNEIILREAVAARVPVIDLRLVCSEPADFSEQSVIEPSVTGGAKIAKMIGEVTRRHERSHGRTSVYS
jgi:hypothetical protein